MEEKTIEIEREGVRVDITLDEISEELGNQYVLDLDEDETEFAYLAALALETFENGGYDINDALTEFINNCEEVDVERLETEIAR